jgi:viroplasmin and RNaseH domain-containing protein
MKITKNDYMKILKYYNIDMDKKASFKRVQDAAENILATKLCRCIKKINPTEKNESKNIALCTNSVLKKKGLKQSRFTCKKKSSFTKHLNKTRRTLTL